MAESTVPDAGRTGAARAASLQSLTRGLAVIRCFDAEHPQLSLAGVARRAALERATARRILHTLEDLGYVRARDGRFALTPRVLELGGAFLASSSLARVVTPHLEDLTAVTAEPSSVAELDRDEIVYLARVSKHRTLGRSIVVGTRLPAYATAMGRVLLAGRSEVWLRAYLARTSFVALTPSTITDPNLITAELGRVRERGWCLVDEELEPGLRSIAVPVVAGADVVAAVNVPATTRTPVEELTTTVLPALLRCAAAIAEDLAAVRTVTD